MRARSALFTLFGDIVRPTGGEAWLSALTACMGALGFTPEATRTALHRMSAEGWVEPRRAGRYAAYRLTPRGEDRLEEAAARIYRLRAADWDGRWRLLVGPVNARGNARGNGSAELARTLAWMGFGQLGAGTWVSPHDHGQRLAAVLAEHGHTEALPFLTEAGDPESKRDRLVVERAWDLRELAAAQAAFVTRWADHPVSADPEGAFRTRIRLVHHWRSFLFLDPGLPVSLLPDDWPGDEASRCFQRFYDAVDKPAWRFYEALPHTLPQPLPNKESA